ncbi:MAG: alpha/beta hydrolase [Clostridia bacterium]|nr:alpha/beta hydrolase [Clostridia bacterium]
MSKALKIVWIMLGVLLVVVIAAVLFIKSMMPGGDTNNAITEGYYKRFQSAAPLEMKYAQPGSYTISYTEFASDNTAIEKVRVWYPQELTDSNRSWPMILVVNASGTPASAYAPFFPRLASWGFVVVGNEDGQTGTGETASLTLDFMLNLPNDSVLAGKIDYDSMGIIGYSQGGAGAICAVTNYENGARYKAMFTGSAAYPALARNMGWEYDASRITIPYFMVAGTGKSDDSGNDPEKAYGGVSPLSAQIANYNSISDAVQKVRARAVGAEHEQMLMRSDGYMTAWMLYQLRDDAQAAAVFIGEEAEILHNDNWQDVEKNQ